MSSEKLLRLGYGRADITPPLCVELAGYGYYLGRRALSVHDPLQARALLFETDKGRSLILSLDLLGVSRAVCEQVFAFAKELGVPKERVMVVSIHTHTGPAVKYHEGCGYVDERYVSTLPSLIENALKEASDNLAEVTGLDFIMRDIPGDYLYNRTIPGGPVDHSMRGFTIRRHGARPIAVISAACHGVFRGRVTAISADFAGRVNELLTEKGFDSIYLNGVCGDIDPYRPTEERLEEFASLLADAFDFPHNALPLTLQSGSLPFTLHMTSVNEKDIRSAASQAVLRAGGKDEPAARVALVWEKEMLAKLNTLSDTETVSCKYTVLGSVPVIALPFEGFTMIGQEIRRITGREDALVLGCAEELHGYLPTRDDIERSSYAALESTFLYKRFPVVPGEAERLGEEMGRGLKVIL